MAEHLCSKISHIALMSLILSSCDSTSNTDTESERSAEGDANPVVSYFEEIAEAFCAKRSSISQAFPT